MTALLVNARLVGTNFAGAFILGVAMNGSDLEGANCTNANLRWSNLTGANIIPHTIAQAYGSEETIFGNTICPDGSNSDEDDGDEHFEGGDAPFTHRRSAGRRMEPQHVRKIPLLPRIVVGSATRQSRSK